MKPLFTVLLAFVCLSGNAQSVNVKLKPTGCFIEDTLIITPKYPEQQDAQFKLTSTMVSDGYYVAYYKDKVVYVRFDQIEETKEYTRFFDKISKKAVEQSKKGFDNEHADLIKKYGRRFAYAIIAKNITLKMTRDMVLEALGKPENIEHTQFDFMTADLWIYPIDQYRSKYIYFTDGRVSGWTEPIIQ